MPRLGKIRLGIKKKSPRTGGEYPVAVDYFVCPTEVQAVYGEKPKKLDVIIPLEDEEMWASQYYRQYSRSRGLVCKGDGQTCRRMVDIETGTIAGRDTQEVTWREGCKCGGQECLDYHAKSCQEVMNLQFLLPKVAGLGIWQIDTGSIHSIMNINNCATMIRAMCGRVSWIPLTLTLEPSEVVNPEDGKKKIVYCMHLRYEHSAESLLMDSEKPRLQVLLGAPSDAEPPDDRLLGNGTPEKRDELLAKGADVVDDFWPNSNTSPPPISQAPTSTSEKQQPMAQKADPPSGQGAELEKKPTEDLLAEALKITDGGKLGYFAQEHGINLKAFVAKVSCAPSQLKTPEQIQAAARVLFSK